jgi:hypothetical protein
MELRKHLQFRLLLVFRSRTLDNDQETPKFALTQSRLLESRSLADPVLLSEFDHLHDLPFRNPPARRHVTGGRRAVFLPLPQVQATPACQNILARLASQFPASEFLQAFAVETDGSASGVRVSFLGT